MKKLNNRHMVALIALLAIGTSQQSIAQNLDTAKSLEESKLQEDVVEVTDKITGKKKTIPITWPTESQIDMIDWKVKSTHYAEDEPRTKKNGRPILGITFSRIDLGFSKIMDEGSFTLSPENQDFKYRAGKTLNFGFDVLQAGYRFNRTFRIYASGGFDWNYYRLKNNIVFKENTTPLAWETIDKEDVDYRKNRLTSTYLRVPLAFEFRGRHKTFFSAGPEWSFLLKGTQRLKSDEFGKQKFKDDYNFSQMRFGAFARAGVKDFGVYAKYYFTDIFENSPQQQDLKNFSFGLTFNF